MNSISKRPDIKPDGDHWRADLRALGYGRYRVGLRADIDRDEATHRAYEILARLRGEGMAELAQRDLFSDGGPELFAGVVDACEADARTVTDGGAAWLREYFRLVRRDLGTYKLQDFAPPSGNARLAAYLRELEARDYSGRTIINRVSTVERVLRFAVERGWLAAPPLHPRMPAKAAPVYRWCNEGMFRALRGAIYLGRSGTKPELRGYRPAEPPAIYIARRQVYLSWLFYTGMHKADADAADASMLFMDARAYVRVNTKSARCVPREQFEMPEQLYADLLALQQVLGRPFYPDEPFTGGPWRNVVPVMRRAAVRLSFPHTVNPAILRRSYAREMLARGYEVRDVADRMGHVSERMINEIYARFPRAAGQHPRSKWTIASSAPHSTPPGGMARVLRIGGAR
jgi:integrase